MRETNMLFGDYIRKKRIDKELSIKDVAEHLGLSLSHMSSVENRNRKPLDGEKLEMLAEFLTLTEDESARMFDLAARENREVPYDIEDTFMHDSVGDLARFALRRSKAGFITEADWKKLIRQSEARKRASEETDGGNSDG